LNNLEIEGLQGDIADNNNRRDRLVEELQNAREQHAENREIAERLIQDERDRRENELRNNDRRQSEFEAEVRQNLETRLAEINAHFEAEIAADVDEHIARNDDTVFEICTRIDRDPETPGNFRVQQVTHGDANAAAAQLQGFVAEQAENGFVAQETADNLADEFNLQGKYYYWH